MLNKNIANITKILQKNICCIYKQRPFSDTIQRKGGLVYRKDE